jgi:serine/threonine protein kinase
MGAGQSTSRESGHENYTEVRKLGEGGFGSVHLVLDKSGAEWALKRVRKKP